MNRRPIMFLVLALAAPVASAQSYAPCKLNVTSRGMVDDLNRTVRACATTNNDFSECTRANADVQVFQNLGNPLPRIKNNENAEYLEAKLRQSNGAAGTWRIVDKFRIDGSKYKSEQGYFSENHYATFCTL